MLTATELTALLPLLVLGAAPVVVMVAIAIRRSHPITLALTMLLLAAAWGSLWIAAGAAPQQVTPLLVIDTYSLFYTGLIIAATFAVAVLSYPYLERHDVHRDELYLLLLVAALGASVLVSSTHFVSFFLGLEVLTVPLYGLIAYVDTRRRPVEAGLKYLVLAASSAAFLLFGMALVYGELGTMDFNRMAGLFASRANVSASLLLPGLALIVTGVGFKLAVVPFHLWTPDVYEGAPAPVTAFVATVSKGGMFALLLRFFYQSGAREFPAVYLVFAIMAIASMFAGNLLALLQNNVKRILAYSSIAHLGYLLVAFLAGGSYGAAAATFYLVAYFVTTLGAFGIVTVLSTSVRDADELEDYRGLFWRRPPLGVIFTLMLLSLAGIPLTAGFIGKFFVVAAGASAAAWMLIIVLVVTSAIGVYYYLRVVVAIYSPPLLDRAPEPPLSFLNGAVLGVLTVLLIWFGVYPAPLLEVIRAAVARL